MDTQSLELQKYNMSLSHCIGGGVMDSAVTDLRTYLFSVIIRRSGDGDL